MRFAHEVTLAPARRELRVEFHIDDAPAGGHEDFHGIDMVI